MLILGSNPIINAYSDSDLLGKLIFLILIFLSIVTWTLFIKKFKLQRMITDQGKLFLQLFQKKRLNPLSLEFTENPHPYASIYKTLKSNTLELLHKNQEALPTAQNVTLSGSDIDFLESCLQSALSAEAKSLENNLFILTTIASLAPFLGLLGTVWGILLTFAELQGGLGNSSHTAVLSGLAMALGTTVLGLVVAIPALIGSNYLKAKCSTLVFEMEDFSQQLLASIELQYREVEIR